MDKAPTTGTTLPFRIDRSLRQPLTRQLVEGFRNAIASGAYRPGEMLPSITALVRLTGVCPVVVRAAIRRLAAEGLVRTHAGVGTEVLDTAETRWKGHVALITSEISDNYTVAQLVGRVAGALLGAGYLATKVAILPRDKVREPPPPSLLLPPGITFGVVFGLFRPEIRKALSLARVPFIVVSRKAEDAPLCQGSIVTDNLSALPEFTAHCLEKGVRSVAEFGYFNQTPTIRDAIRAAGIDYVNFIVPREKAVDPYTNPLAFAMSAMEKRLKTTMGRLPDVIFCADNYDAGGALLSLMRHGIRIPEDVGFVTWMPAGDLPVFWKSLTRLETDPVRDGDELGRIILRVLEGRPLPADIIFGSTYKIGDTFPLRSKC
jgi:DNA-binding transcriptional regulator YhcF (GntR family)